MVIERGDVWWAELEEPRGSEPGYHRPLLIIQSDSFNRSRIDTTIGVILTGNLRLLAAPGNVLIPAKASGLPKDSVANVSQLMTLDRHFLLEKSGKVPLKQLSAVEEGLRLVLGL